MMEDYRLWKQWAKHNKDGWFYGLCVLLGIRHSPSFEMYYKGFAPLRKIMMEKED